MNKLTVFFLFFLAAQKMFCYTLSGDDSKFLDMVQRQTFNYFIECTNMKNGLVMDRADNFKEVDLSYSPATIAGTGFGLTCLVAGVERGWVTREKAIEITRCTLDFFLHEMETVRGFYYHFVDMKTGKRVWNCELSSIDTALFLAGVLLAGEYYKDSRITRLADLLYCRVDWKWMMNGGKYLSMGWKPETGFLSEQWKDYAESMILYIMALGSPTYPIEPECWSRINRHVGKYREYTMISCPPLFTHQYSHIWIDFRDMADGYANYFYNSIQATLANRRFCIDSMPSFKTYGEQCWGLTACIGPDGYMAYGSSPGQAVSDGTVAPTAAGGSMVFTPEKSLEVLKWIYSRHRPQMWGRFGFSDSFNIDRNWYAVDSYAINQGPLLLMIENYRSGLVWKYFMRNKYMKQGLALAGFKKGGRKGLNMKRLDTRNTAVYMPHLRPEYHAAKIDDAVETPDPSAWDTAGWILFDESRTQSGYSGQKLYSAELGILFNTKYLFVKGIVNDSEIMRTHPETLMFQDDAVEIYLDPSDDLLKWGDGKDFQIIVSPGKNRMRVYEFFQKGRLNDRLKVEGAVTQHGYEFVLAIPRDEFGITGRNIGFTAAFHNVDRMLGSDCKLNWFFCEPGIMLGKVILDKGAGHE